MTDLIQLWNSTQDLYERFDLDSPNEDRRRKLIEEVLELITVSVLEDNGHGGYRDIINEAADVIVTVLGLLQGHDIEYDDLLTAMGRIAEKNNAKTTETHHIVNGLITRRKS